MQRRSILISAICCLAVSSLPGCAIFRTHHSPQLAAQRIYFGRLPQGATASVESTPQAATLPAHNIQGVYVVRAPDWVPGSAPVTPIRFVGTGAQVAKRPISRVEPRTKPPLPKPEPGAAPRRKGPENTTRRRTQKRPVLRVFFGVDSASIPRKERILIAAVRGVRFCVAGHADPRGGKVYNLRLSATRAIAVGRLLQRASKRRIIEIEAFGKTLAGPRYGFDRRADVYRGACPQPGAGHPGSGSGPLGAAHAGTTNSGLRLVSSERAR